jgi:hypothetical protein
MPVPCFCCFCVSEKLHKKYSRNWTKQKSEFLFFPTRDKVQRCSEVGPEPSGRTHANLHNYICWSRQDGPYNLISQDRAHMTCGCTRSYYTRNLSDLFVPWVAVPTNSPCRRSQHTNPPRCFINIIVFIIAKHISSPHNT